jgi:hypothetical protein
MDNIYYDEKKYSASVLLISGAAAYALGFATNYFLNKKKINEYVTEIESINYYSKADCEATLVDPDQLQFDFDFKHAEYDTNAVLVDNNPYSIEATPNDPNDIVVDKQPNPVSIFRGDSNMDWDFEAELAKRSPDKPYIIHETEYFAHETDYSQSTLTYYAGDDILVDEREVPIYNYKSVTGELLFGHGSEDQNVVYVRNDRLSGEYEILRDSGSYEIEVLGNQYEKTLRDIDLKSGNVLKFRPE